MIDSRSGGPVGGLGPPPHPGRRWYIAAGVLSLVQLAVALALAATVARGVLPIERFLVAAYHWTATSTNPFSFGLGVCGIVSSGILLVLLVFLLVKVVLVTGALAALLRSTLRGEPRGSVVALMINGATLLLWGGNCVDAVMKHGPAVMLGSLQLAWLTLAACAFSGLACVIVGHRAGR